MALLDSEVARIKYELGFNILTVGAEPYIGIAAIFSQVIQVYMGSGASTTSTTAVTAATTATPVTLTLASGTGFNRFDRVVIDVDDRQEIVTVENISGASLTVLLTKAHSGTYPVTVEGGESIVRGILGKLRAIETQISDAGSSAGIKKVDEIEFFGNDRGTQMTTLLGLQKHWREELRRALFGTGGESSGNTTRLSLY